MSLVGWFSGGEGDAGRPIPSRIYALRRVNPSGTDTVDRDTLVALWTDLSKKYPADFAWE